MPRLKKDTERIKICGIYKIISPSGKIYIGLSIDIELRWKYYKRLSCKGQKKLYSSFVGHGVDKHIFEIIEECSEDKLLERETWWKLHYKVLEIPSLCCRLDGKGSEVSDETKLKISQSNEGIPKSEDHKKKIGDVHRGIKHRPLTIEEKDKIRLSRIGMSKGSKRKIDQYDLSDNFVKSWDSIKEAAISINGNKSSIQSCAVGRLKTAYGFKWKYFQNDI